MRLRRRKVLPCSSTPESRRAAARLLPFLGSLLLLDVLAPLLGRQAAVATWVILSVQGLAIAGLLTLVVAVVRVRSR